MAFVDSSVSEIPCKWFVGSTLDIAVSPRVMRLAYAHTLLVKARPPSTELAS